MIFRLFWYSYTVVLLLKHLHQKGRGTVDWAWWRHNLSEKRGLAPESCTGPRICQDQPWILCTKPTTEISTLKNQTLCDLDILCIKLLHTPPNSVSCNSTASFCHQFLQHQITHTPKIILRVPISSVIYGPSYYVIRVVAVGRRGVHVVPRMDVTRAHVVGWNAPLKLLGRRPLRKLMPNGFDHVDEDSSALPDMSDRIPRRNYGVILFADLCREKKKDTNWDEGN